MEIFGIFSFYLYKMAVDKKSFKVLFIFGTFGGQFSLLQGIDTLFVVEKGEDV